MIQYGSVKGYAVLKTINTGVFIMIQYGSVKGYAVLKTINTGVFIK